MRLVKVVFASIILSFMITLILSFINYIPVLEREPDTYYFSIGERFFFGMIYITPIILMLGVIAFSCYVLFEKIKRFPPIVNVVLSLVIATSISSLVLYMINKSDETNDIYLIPEGYEGEVYVFYNVKGAPMIETEDGYEVHVINEKGYYLTSEPDMDYGTVTDKYYYVDDKGNRTPIDNKCVSGFGMAGYSTFMDDQAFDMIYTGFKLTKDQCSEGFMTENHSMGEDAGEIIQEILKDHYDFE